MENTSESFIFKDDLHIASQQQTQNGEPQNEESLTQQLSETEDEIYAIKTQILDLKTKLEEKEKQTAKIKDRLEQIITPKAEIQLNEPKILPTSSAIERINFVFNLFQGRRDVYAERALRKDKKTISYYTVCRNNFQEGCFHKLPEEKRKGKTCLDCPIRQFAPLTPSIYVKQNMKNENPNGLKAIGIYAMLPGNMCKFLAIDLDEKTWKKDALEIASAARKEGFQIAIERSFSGNGAHLWLFFNEEVPASKARELAFTFIDKACENSKTVSLKSYDRIFPTQDELSGNGLGNLILMPLVKSAAFRKENSGTVFVDNNFEKYPDQIAFLSSLPQYSRRDVELYLLSSKSTENNPFSLTSYEEKEPDILWAKNLPKVSQKDCLIETLPIFLSAGISIPKETINAKLQNALKRLACFINPEYFRTKNRNNGYIPQGISMFIETFIESNEVLQLPRGLRSSLERYLNESSIPYKIYDYRAINTGLEADFKGCLRDEQKSAFEVMMDREIGILEAATSFGKTVVAAQLIAARRERTLILVQSRKLLDQWKNSLQTFLQVRNQPIKREGKRLNKTGIGIYGGTADSLSSYVDVAMIQSLSVRMPDFVRGYGMVIVDECHHIAADSFVKVMHAIRPRYLYGLSATVERKDDLEKIVYAQCGPVIYKYDANKLAYRRGISQIFVPRFISTSTANFSVFTSLNANFNNTEAQKAIAFDDVRNNLIVSDIKELYLKGKRILVLTHLLDHIKELEKRLLAENIPVISVNGSMATLDKKQAFSLINKTENKAVIISTGRFLGEGADIPYLDTLLVVAPVSWKGIVSQYVGRISREYNDKSEVCIYDYVDLSIPAFVSMYTKRLKTYKALGYVAAGSIADSIVGSIDKATASDDLFKARSFYSETDIYPVLCTLIANTKHSIVISSPRLELNYGTTRIIEQLATASSHGITIEIRTSTEYAQAEAIAKLRQSGISVRPSTSCYLKFATFDNQHFLFGELNLLGSYINVTKSSPSLSHPDTPKVMILGINSQICETLTQPSLFG